MKIGKRLDRVSRETGKSINTLVLELLQKEFGPPPGDWLLKYVTWSEDEAKAFDELVRTQRTIDEDLWR
ncbi:MAG: hypothetical protein SFW67_37020 [Myxococcaceae bacterium]|nr:hypothetical protein [Myxococcaceae bacterium]